MPTIAQALATALARGLERIDAQLLLLHALGRPQHDRAWLLAHDDEPLADGARQRFDAACAQRSDGVPLAYLVGEKEFHGLRLRVAPGVLVPRPDTETLVDWAIELLRERAQPRVADLGTGSGAIALAIKQAVPSAHVDAVDMSGAALDVARGNALALGLAIAFRQASWLDGAGRYDLVASNPPYVAEGDPHLPHLRHEPAEALVGGADGLDAIRAIVAQAPAHLTAGGWLLLEHGWDQASAVRDLLWGAGFARVASRKDLAGIERVTGAQWGERG